MQTIRTIFAGAASFFAQLVSAERVASAVEGHRRPDARDLAVLGIDPAAFARVIRA